MGGDQSLERKESEDETEEQEQPADGDGSGSAEEPSGELPQCQMGNRKVDNMCFMISCTNWY